MKKLIVLIMVCALLCALPVTARAEDTLELVVSGLTPSGMTMDGSTMYIADSFNRAVWSLQGREISLIAGGTGTADPFGRPAGGYVNGELSEAVFAQPWDVLPFKEGLLVSDSENNVLRYIDLELQQVSTFSGNGVAAYSNGSKGFVTYNEPTGLALGDDGTVYIADTGNNVIRAMDENGRVTTFAGSSEGCTLGGRLEAQLNRPTGLCFEDGVLYIADTGNHRVVAVKGEELVLVAGAALSGDEAIEGGFADGSAEEAKFSSPRDVAVMKGGGICVADTGNGAIRLVEEGQVTTLCRLDGGSYPVSPASLLQGSKLYIGDLFSHCLLWID